MLELKVLRRASELPTCLTRGLVCAYAAETPHARTNKPKPPPLPFSDGSHPSAVTGQKKRGKNAPPPLPSAPHRSSPTWCLPSNNPSNSQSTAFAAPTSPTVPPAYTQTQTNPSLHTLPFQMGHSIAAWTRTQNAQTHLYRALCPAPTRWPSSNDPN